MSYYTRDRFTNRVGPGKRIAGPHAFDTEAQTLDEALDIIKSRQKRPRAKQKNTLKREFAGNRLRQYTRPVSLSDRVIPAATNRFARTGKKASDVVWTREEVIAAHATGMFKTVDLAQRAKVNSLQIIFWVYGTAQPPVNWRCEICGTPTTSAKTVEHGYQPMCCGRYWYEGLAA